MNETIKNVLQEAFWVLIPMAIGYLVNFLRRHLRVNAYKKLLRINDNVEKPGETWLKFITANPQLEDVSELVTCGYVFEYRAAGELGSTMNKLYGPDLVIKTAMSKDHFSYTSGDLRSNLVLIGGPFHNCVTRHFLEWMGPSWPFHFEEDATLVYTDPEGKLPSQRFSPVAMEGKFYGEDYALIMNVKNPYDPEKRLIFIAGCRSIGCYGGAIFLSQQLKEIHKKVQWDEYALVVSCSGDAEDLNARPKLEEVFPLNVTFSKENQPK